VLDLLLFLGLALAGLLLLGQPPPLLLRIETPAQIVYDVREGKRLVALLSGSALSSLRQHLVLSHVGAGLS
jgi:hypothetical protein